MVIMKSCAACGKEIVWGGYSEGDSRYCSLPCYTAHPGGGFCEACQSLVDTSPVGGTFMFNGIGTRLIARGVRCPSCHSIESRRWFVIFLIPIFPVASYRTRWVGHNRFVARKLVR